MKTIDKNLIDTLKKKYEDQKTIANTFDYHDGPVDIQGVYSFSSKIIDRIFDGRFANKMSQTSSWIADQSIPFQLLEHKHLTVDLKVEELSKEKPYNIPIDSLCFLARDGFLYLNLRDYESEEKKDFQNLGAGNCAKNLNKILSKAPDQIYFGGALREPFFNAGLKWNGKTEMKINDIQEDFYGKLEASYEAYKLELDENEIKTDNTTFRGEEQNLIAASWHYAFLSSFRSQIPNIFSDQNKKNNLSPTVHGIETKKNKAIESANYWKKKKKSSGFRRKAALDFLDLAGHLRTLHQIYTAPITASWGTNYSMTSHEFIKARKHRSSILADRDISDNNELKRFIYFILGEDTTYGPPTDIKVLEEFDQWIFDSNKIKELTSVLHDGTINNEYNKVSKQINDAYLHSEQLNAKSLEQLYNKYEKIRKSRRAKILKSTKLNSELDLSASLVSAKVFNWLDLSLGKISLNISLNDFIENIFFPSKGERSLYRVSQIVEK